MVPNSIWILFSQKISSEFCDNVLINELRTLIDKYKKLISDHGVIILCAKKGDKLSFLIGVTDQLTDKIGADEIAKFASSISNGKGGGGRKDFAQAGGTNINKIEEAFKAVTDKIN